MSIRCTAAVALAEQHSFCHRLPENMVFASSSK